MAEIGCCGASAAPASSAASFFGGKPRWLHASNPPAAATLACGSCGEPRALLAQLQCPVGTRARVLYVLACNRAACSSEPGSWLVLRAQAAAAAPAEPAFGGCGFGGFGGGGGFGSGGDDDAWRAGASAWGDGADEAVKGKCGAAEELSLEALMLRNEERASAPTEVPKPKPKASKAKPPQAVVAVAVAAAPGGGEPEEEAAADSIGETAGGLVCRTVVWWTEPEADAASGLGVGGLARVQELAAQVDTSGGGEAQGAAGGSDDVYERALVGSDLSMQKFLKRVARWPGQCVRYEYNGNPLWPLETAVSAGHCATCGAARVFEMQLMPALIHLLGVDDRGMCWLTAAIFSCPHSCDAADGGYSHEGVACAAEF